MRVPQWGVFAVAGAVVTAVYPLLGSAGARDLVYLAVGLSSTFAVGWGVLLHRPSYKGPWLLLCAGQLLWVCGDAVDSWSPSAGFPSAADVLYLGAYPLLGMGLLLLVRARRPGRDVGGLLDAGIMTAGLGALSWTVLAKPTLVLSGHSLAAASVGAAYPVADIVLVGLLIRLISTGGARSPALRWLLGGVALLISGDTASAALGLYSSSATSSFDVLWLGAYVAWGAAALHPSMKTLSQPCPGGVARFTRTRQVVLGVATMVSPATLAVQAGAGWSLDVWAAVTGSVVSFALVVTRMSVAMTEAQASHEQRERLQGDLAHQAVHDHLTGLPNRAQALGLLTGALSRAQRSGALIGLLFIDLDGFKTVNDTLGHAAGDEVLRVLAGRFAAAVRGGDVVARLGGDEFVVLLEPLDTEASAVGIADRLIEVAAEPVALGSGRDAQVGASIGVALSQDGFIDPERLLQEADTAVYRAKGGGRGRAEIFDQALRHELVARADLESALTAAIATDSLQVHYQPIITVDTGAVTGYEALVRWDRPGCGTLAPDVFIPIAETSDLICDLDTWVLRLALTQLATWLAMDPAQAGSLTMAINISGRHAAHPRILDDVRRALTDTEVPATRLVLEITETALGDDLLAITHLHTLRELGVAISLDDFGTGYSSISRLQHLPIDSIKIDRSFLDPDQSASHQLLNLIVQAAHAFDLPVIAEGVEHQQQLHELHALGCEQAQGYHLGRPAAAPADGRPPHSTTAATPLRHQPMP